jgi:hypothetical protein
MPLDATKLRRQTVTVLPFTLWLLVLLLLAMLAHAQPTNWQSYQRGSTTYYSGTDANGGRWTGSSYEQWGKRFYEFAGPDDQTKRCSAYALPARGTRSAGRDPSAFRRPCQCCCWCKGVDATETGTRRPLSRVVISLRSQRVRRSRHHSAQGH